MFLIVKISLYHINPPVIIDWLRLPYSSPATSSGCLHMSNFLLPNLRALIVPQLSVRPVSLLFWKKGTCVHLPNR